MLKFLKTNRFIIILASILLISFLIRIWQLGRIGELIFDEVYFVNFSRNYLAGISFFDIHPPLGKLLIALPIKFFEDTSFTWRIAPAIFGTLLILLGYLSGKEISNRTTGIFVALIMALDGMLLVYSRAGLIDIFLVFFILLSFFNNFSEHFWEKTRFFRKANRLTFQVYAVSIFTFSLALAKIS